MGRMIDADKLKKDVLDLQNCYNGFSDTYDKACIIGVIDEQPSAQPEQRWIPVTERLPEELVPVLVTIKMACRLPKWVEEKSFYHVVTIGVIDEGRWDCGTVLAWMSLPEPYREVNE